MAILLARSSGALLACVLMPAMLLAAAAPEAPTAQPRQPALPLATATADYSIELRIQLGHSTQLRAGTPIRRIAVADPSVSDVIQLAPRDLTVLGKGKGTTSVTIWLEDGDGAQRPIVVLVRVLSDPQSGR